MSETLIVTTENRQVFYPESDGKPRAETEVHIDAVIYVREALKDYFRSAPDIYVNSNMLLYYEEGNPSACVAPDVFVVKGVPKHERRIYKLWEELQPPTVIFEITSRGTRLEDLGTKRALYELLGVQEYFLYDPLGEYLHPALQGYLRHVGEFQRSVPNSEGRFVSEALGVELQLEHGRLRLIDPLTKERLLSPAEAQDARRAAEVRITQAEDARRAAESRATEAEKELERLRVELLRLRSGTS
jgi:Uma2 family endonuclease